MKTLTFGPTGVAVPRIGQGTWNLEEGDRREALAALRRGLDLGLTHVDTAELYGRGAVEEMVGEALEGRRHQVILVSKVLPSNASRSGTVAACERSLRRLRTDHLDGYLLHWTGSHPLEETVAAFESLVEVGKIGWWGVSNFDEVWLERLLQVTTADRITCNQVLYHLEERAIEHAVLPACQLRGIAVVGYSPFGSGAFPEADTPGGRVLGQIAARYGATARQVALAFLARDRVFQIPKAGRVAHVEDNAGAGDLELDAEAVAEIDAAFPRGPRRPGVPTL